MQRLLIAIALCMPLFASAADLRIACIGAESDDCPIAVDLNADMEALVAHWDGPPNPEGKPQRLSLAWSSYATLFGSSPLQWLSASSAGPLHGSSRPLNGELTKRQLAQASVTLETIRNQTFCWLDERTPRCLATPLFPARPEKVRISCIGSEHDDCPAAIDVWLEDETLTARLFHSSTDGTRQSTALQWCGHGEGGQPIAWVAWNHGQGCTVTGSFRVLNGELTRRQLAQAFAQFTTRKVEVACGFEGAGLGEQKPVCRR